MRFRRFLSVTKTVTARNIHNYLSSPALLIPSIAFPLVFFLTFLGGMGRIADVPGLVIPGGYKSFQFTFILFQASGFSGIFSGFAMAQDFERGFIRRLMLAAPQRGGIVAGYVIGAVFRAVIPGTVLFSVGLVAGVRVEGSALEVVLLLCLAVSFTLIAALWSCGIAMRLRTIQAAPLMMVPFFLSLFLTPVFLPLAFLTGWLQTAAENNPITRILGGARGLIAGRPNGTGAAFLVAALMAALLTIWSWRSLRRAERAGG